MKEAYILEIDVQNFFPGTWEKMSIEQQKEIRKRFERLKKRQKMKVLLTIHEMFYIIYEMIPKVSKAKGDYRIEQTAHLIRMRGLFLYMAYSKI